MNSKSFARTVSTLGFVHNDLDRLANSRDDAQFIEAERRDPAARTLVVVHDSVLLGAGPDGSSPWFGFEALHRLGPVEEVVFLGRGRSGPCFAARLGGTSPDEYAGREDIGVFNLRSVAVDGSVPARDLGALAQGKAILHWHKSHRFCSTCGTASQASGAGWRRECPSCGTHHFPRTDPVVIMLATDGDRCLLGRQPRFPPSMYSCLAGFLEPGETIEAAVARELEEEAGIAVGSVTYLGSQPWPFPASLMIGCLAEARTTQIVVDHHELEDARWFTRDEVKAMLAGQHPEGLVCPVPMAIAHHIVRAWVDRD